MTLKEFRNKYPENEYKDIPFWEDTDGAIVFIGTHEEFVEETIEEIKDEYSLEYSDNIEPFINWKEFADFTISSRRTETTYAEVIRSLIEVGEFDIVGW